MSVTDPIADMLTRIRNATMVQHRQVVMPTSKMREAIVRILKDEGFVENYDVIPAKPQSVLRISLKYAKTKRSESVITGLKRVSKPGLRVYTSKDKIPSVYGGMGVAIISTSRGIMTGEDAKRQGIGGEVLCYVW